MILFVLFLCLAAYYVYLLVNPSTHYTALSYAPLAGVVTVVFAVLVGKGQIKIPKVRPTRQERYAMRD